MSMEIQLELFEIGPGYIAEAVHAARTLRATALLVMSSPLAGAMPNTQAIAQAAIRERVPSIFLFRHFTTAGGLMSYGPISTDVYRQEGRQVASIVHGANVSSFR